MSWVSSDLGTTYSLNKSGQIGLGAVLPQCHPSAVLSMVAFILTLGLL